VAATPRRASARASASGRPWATGELRERDPPTSPRCRPGAAARAGCPAGPARRPRRRAARSATARIATRRHMRRIVSAHDAPGSVRRSASARRCWASTVRMTSTSRPSREPKW
jgi:hypothetical protein